MNLGTLSAVFPRGSLLQALYELTMKHGAGQEWGLEGALAPWPFCSL